jgi:hypothetical protein
MLLRFTEMCSARIEGVQDSQSCDLMIATCIVVMIVEGGQVGGGLAFFVVMITPLGLFITPEKHQSPQAASAMHAKNVALLSHRFRRVQGGYRVGLLQNTELQPCAERGSAVDSMPVRVSTQDGRFVVP